VFTCTTKHQNLCGPRRFLTTAVFVSLRQHCPQLSLPTPRSPGSTLICFSLRPGVSAVNIPSLRLRRAVFICGQSVFPFGPKEDLAKMALRVH
jgi:hypothetical protein